ncbi:MAG: hypothetical protein RLZZ303_2533 [Candidatus Hydrogenedentota bacterium]
MNELQVGRVGIFWVYKERILSNYVPWSEGERYGEFVNGLSDHCTYWATLQRQLPELRRFEYEQVPRGRVVYRTTDDTFLLYGSERFARDEIQQRRVMEDFQLVGKRVIVKPDEHYGPVLGMLEGD